jgi:hypothetical protein
MRDLEKSASRGDAAATDDKLKKFNQNNDRLKAMARANADKQADPLRKKVRERNELMMDRLRLLINCLFFLSLQILGGSKCY